MALTDNELWLLRYLNEHCESPDQRGCISVDRDWENSPKAKTDHGKTIASGLGSTYDQLESLVSRLAQLGLVGKSRDSTYLDLWITAVGQDAARATERDPKAVRNEILQTVLEIQGTSRKGVDDTTIAGRLGLAVDEVQGHLGILDEEGRIGLSRTMHGRSAFLQPEQRQKAKESAAVSSKPVPKTDTEFHRRCMEMAVEAARKSQAEDERPHPKVGAVVVKQGEILAVSHRGELSEGDHAEFTVLEKKLSENTLVGATVYATLEPCTTRNHPKVPCAVRLIERKVARVYIGMLDPNPDIRGRGERLLRDANIEVHFFDHDLTQQISELNRDFIRAQDEGDAIRGRDDNFEKAVPSDIQANGNDAAEQLSTTDIQEPALVTVRSIANRLDFLLKTRGNTRGAFDAAQSTLKDALEQIQELVARDTGDSPISPHLKGLVGPCHSMRFWIDFSPAWPEPRPGISVDVRGREAEIYKQFWDAVLGVQKPLQKWVQRVEQEMQSGQE